MKAKAEAKANIEAKRKEVLDFLNAGETEKAKALSDELEEMIKNYEAMPAENKLAERMATKMDKKNQIKAAVNAYLHKGWQGMTDEQKQALNATDTPGQVETTTSPSRGSVLVPTEVASFVGTMDTGVYRLRTRVSEYFSRTLSGRIPLANNPTAGLVAQFDEFPAGGISRGDIKFGSVDWTVKDYGLIIPVSNDLLQDASVDVFGIIAEQFYRAQVITENALILAAIDGNGAATSVADWKDILKEINGTDPVAGADKIIVTNTDGWNYLDTLTDDNGHPLLTMALVDDPKRYFRGFEVVQLPDAVLATDSSTGTIPFYVGSFRDAIYFIERQGLEISYNPYSDSAYSKNAVDVRVTCRIDCKTKFATAVKKLAYTPE